MFDLRFNPGGLLNAAVEISDMFLDHGVIVWNRGNRVRKQEITADKDTLIPNSIPIVVLVNQYSASAWRFFPGR